MSLTGGGIEDGAPEVPSRSAASSNPADGSAVGNRAHGAPDDAGSGAPGDPESERSKATKLEEYSDAERRRYEAAEQAKQDLTVKQAMPASRLAHYQAAETASKRLWVWSAGFLGVVVVAAVLGGLVLKVPYVALVPGSARDTEPLLAVSGTDEFPSDGELLFTTVRVRQRPNLWEYLWLKADDDATVVPEEEILGDRTPEENREVNLMMMTSSKQVAVAVALEQLGYDAVKTDAVFVDLLVPDTPAEKVLVPGDSILAIDGVPTTTVTELVDILSGRAPGDQVELSIQHLGQQETELVEVVLAPNPERPENGFLGIQPRDRPQFLNDVGFVVDIDSGSVGGPSAGLAFTLAVLDQLTPGELTGGAQVAVTGTIDPAGEVGAVGGVLQKTAAVKELGADAFIVPSRLNETELDAIFAKAGDDLLIIPVENLDEALAALGTLGGDTNAVEEYATANGAE